MVLTVPLNHPKDDNMHQNTINMFICLRIFNLNNNSFNLKLLTSKFLVTIDC